MADIFIEEYKYKNINFKVIRDDLVPGGTKSRAVEAVLEKDKDEYVYAGADIGAGQVAISIAAEKLGKKATFFSHSQSEFKPHKMQLEAMSHGANYIYVNGDLKALMKEAEKYANRSKKRQLLKFGFGSQEFKKMLIKNLKKAFKKNPIEPKRMWLVAGSATLLECLATIFPETEFMVVQVGKKLWPDQLGVRNQEYPNSLEFKSQLFIAPEKFQTKAKLQPIYPSLEEYDAKLWQFFVKYGKNGDYIWNVYA